MKRRAGAWIGAAVLAVAPGWGYALEATVTTETILRHLERDTENAENAKAFPVYEYLGLDLAGIGPVSFHAYGWGRHSFDGAGVFEDDSAGELLYGYLRYAPEQWDLEVRAGRTSLFSGPANEVIDGVVARAGLAGGFSVEAFGGMPAAFDASGGRSGDRLWGARVAHRWGSLWDLGVSFQAADDDGDRVEELASADGTVRLGDLACLRARGVFNTADGGTQEVTAELPVYVGPFTLTPRFERYELEAFPEAATTRSGPLGFLRTQDETLALFGLDAEWTIGGSAQVGARWREYRYTERDEGARYGGLLGAFPFGESSWVGAEVGRAQGDEDEHRYVLGRAWAYASRGVWFGSADLVAARYDEEIGGDRSSVYGSLTGGVRALDDRLEASLSADYSADPYYDKDVRALVNLKWTFSVP
ncbi:MULTISPECIES: hypothetical protein [Deferrisoma]